VRVAVLCAWLVLTGTIARAADDVLLTFDHAELVTWNHADPPPADLRGERVTLPDSWRTHRPVQSGFGWYRFTLPAGLDPETEWGVYVSDLDITAVVYVDGVRVGACGDPERPETTQCSNSPLFASFPGQLLGDGPARLEIRIWAEPFAWTRLSAVEFGPEAQLRPRYERQYFVQVRLAEFGTVLGVVLMLVIGVLWLGRRHEPVYGWFLIASICWTVYSLTFHLQERGVGFWTWQRLIFMSADLFAVAGAFTVYRMLGVRKPKLEGLLLGYAAAVPLALWLTPVRYFDATSGTLHGLALLTVTISFATCARDLRRLPRTEVATLAFCLALCFGFGLHDYLVHFEVVPLRRPFLLQFVGPVILAAFGAMLTTRFVREYRRAENLNAELEKRVDEKHRELESNFERMRELERSHVLALERARLMREVHDGIGGQLVSTLAMVETGHVASRDVADALRGALDEMRLVVQSLDPLVDDLPTLLGVVRARVEPRLAAQGLRFEWAVCDLPPMPELGRDGFLHVLRIVQEAITNVVKHAKARVITVRTGLRDGADGRRGVYLEVADDGIGSVGPRIGGRGVANMRQRADEIGARLSIRAGNPGTRVELWLPLADGRDAGATPAA
jgi:signal transduction histidine kinase